MGTMTTIVADDGFRLAAYLAEPAGAPRGALVLIQEIFGVNGHIRDVCDGYAYDGYRVLAPALFDRYEKGVELDYTADDIARGRALRAMATADAAMADVEAARAEVALAGRVGIIGYCWGGTIAWLAACRITRLACAVCYYGGGILEASAEQPKCPVLAHFGERDTAIPIAGVKDFAAAHPEVAVHIYAADHGFNCDRRGAYDAAASTLARQRTLDFLRRQIG